MAEKTEKDPKRCVTPVGRLSYPKLTKPESSFGKEPTYRTEFIIDEGADLMKLKRAIAAAVLEKWPDPKKRPKLKLPIRSGAEDRPNNPQYEGCIFISADSKSKPDIVIGKAMNPSEDEDVWPGRRAIISVTASPFEMEDRETGAKARGVKLYLNSVMLLADDGTRYGNANSNAEQDFEDVEVDDDLDAEAYGADDDEMPF